VLKSCLSAVVILNRCTSVKDPSRVIVSVNRTDSTEPRDNRECTSRVQKIRVSPDLALLGNRKTMWPLKSNWLVKNFAESKYRLEVGTQAVLVKEKSWGKLKRI
jgi:hypothetical protein